MVCGNIFTGPPRPNGWKLGLQSLNRPYKYYNFLGDSKSGRRKWHYWFKRYGNVAEKSEFLLLYKVVKLVGGGSVINRAYPVLLLSKCLSWQNTICWWHVTGDNWHNTYFIFNYFYWWYYLCMSRNSVFFK